MLKTNFHTHTVFSDGKNTAEEMVQAALERGFARLGFSDHGYAPHDEAAMSLENERLYRAEVARLKEKYAGRIEIYLGYEHDFSMPDTDLAPYDYVIESVHFFHKGGKFIPIDSSKTILQGIIDDWYSSDPYAMCRDYFDMVAQSILRGGAQIVGHIGLVSKFNENNAMFDMEDARYLDPAREVIRLAVEKKMLVEVNTGAMSRGYRTQAYPGRTLLKSLFDMGGQAILSSDCHRAEWIDFGFEQQTGIPFRDYPSWEE